MSLFLKFYWKFSKLIVLILKLFSSLLKFVIIKVIIGKAINNDRYFNSCFKFSFVKKIKGMQNIWIIKKLENNVPNNFSENNKYSLLESNNENVNQGNP